MASQSYAEPETLLLTIILRHDQSKTLDQINEHLENTGFWKEFPPEGVEIVNWHIVMGIGHVITLKVPPAQLRTVNLAIEKNAWGAFRSEFYPTYNFIPMWQTIKEKNKKE
ncbi:hypothetical protein KDK77_04675 [bacterium]|nr:hypothetical protein [bacterium]MCP5461669.1 hypothetical protein [bacterium]